MEELEGLIYDIMGPEAVAQFKIRHSLALMNLSLFVKTGWLVPTVNARNNYLPIIHNQM